MCILSLLVSIILQLYFSWFLQKSLTATLLLPCTIFSKLFSLMSEFYRYSFNEKNDYYHGIILCLLLIWPPETRSSDTNLTGIGGRPSFGFSTPLFREYFFATLHAAFNETQESERNVTAVKKMCIQSKIFHCYGLQWVPLRQCYRKCGHSAVWDLTLDFPDTGSLFKTD